MFCAPQEAVASLEAGEKRGHRLPLWRVSWRRHTEF